MSYIKESRLDVNRLYTTQEAAKLMRVSAKTIRRLIGAGEIKANTNQRPHLLYGQHLLKFIDSTFKYKPKKGAQ